MDTPGDTRTIIYVPDTPDTDRWYRLALEYCERRRYSVVGLVAEKPEGGGWQAVLELFRADAADVVVVGRRDHLPAQRRPRMQVIAQAPPRRSSTARQRAPGAVTRRPAAARPPGPIRRGPGRTD